jgi:hypothetical protein
MKTLGNLLVVVALTILPIQAQTAVKRHPGDHLHYDVTVADGDIAKITRVVVNLKTSAPVVRPDQIDPSTQFGSGCQKTTDPRIWTCDVPIPQNVASGDYQVYSVVVASPEFAKGYGEGFHVPTVPIENPNTFTPPSKVTVTEKP